MSILLPHTSLDFKKNEIKTLGIIHTRGFFNDPFPDLAAAISTAYDRHRGIKGKKNFDFEFVSDFDIRIEKKSHRIVMHASAKGNYDFTTYSIGICEEGDSDELIRRFHFDYVHSNGGKKQKVPVSHLQYGGKSGEGFNGKVYRTSNIEHWLSEPRLYYPPMNLALLLDIVFTEFQSDITTKIVNDPEWRSLVRANEVFALKEYFSTISSHIDTERHKKELVRDICYV